MSGDIDLPAALARLRNSGPPDINGMVSVFADDLAAALAAYNDERVGHGIGLVSIGQRWRVTTPTSAFHGDVCVVAERHHGCWAMRRPGDGGVIYMHDNAMHTWGFVPDPEVPDLLDAVLPAPGQAAP